MFAITQIIFYLSGLEYVLMICIREWFMSMPEAGETGYFDFKYYSHAIGQYSFFSTYFLLLWLASELPAEDEIMVSSTGTGSTGGTGGILRSAAASIGPRSHRYRAARLQL